MTTTPFGTWPSPLTVDDADARSFPFSTVRIDGDCTYWKETADDGRGVIMRAADGAIAEVTRTFDDGVLVDVASRVHEYGGPDFAVADGVLVFSARRDGRLYVMTAEGDSWSTPAPATPDDGARYADLTIQDHTVYAVAERHLEDRVENSIVAVDLMSGAVVPLHEGPDFVANPVPSPSGSALAWYEWDQPEMPWTSTRLCVAELTETERPSMSARSRSEGSSISPAWVGDDDLAFDGFGPGRLVECVPLRRPAWGSARVRLIDPADVEFAASAMGIRFVPRRVGFRVPGSALDQGGTWSLA